MHFGFMNVLLLHSGQQHVLTPHMVCKRIQT